MKPTLRRILTDVVVLAVAAILVFYLSSAITGYADYFRYAYGGLILIGGVMIARDVSRIIAVDFRSGLGKEAPVLSNAVAVIGYLASAVASAFYLSFSPTALLAGAPFSALR